MRKAADAELPDKVTAASEGRARCAWLRPVAALRSLAIGRVCSVRLRPKSNDEPKARSAHGSGDIVFTTPAVVKEPAPQLLLSNVMRAGVTALAKSLSRELAPYNIRVNSVAPGYFDTGRVRRRVDEIAQRDGVPREVATRIVAGDIVAGRIGAPEELAELVCFLATRRAGFVTGATVQIDGGSSRGLF